jgi:hypothetical protein
MGRQPPATMQLDGSRELKGLAKHTAARLGKTRLWSAMPKLFSNYVPKAFSEVVQVSLVRLKRYSPSDRIKQNFLEDYDLV